MEKITTKKKSAKKVKLKLKKVSRAIGYQIYILKTRKAKKPLVKITVRKLKVTVTSDKLKNKNKLYVKARAYVIKANGKKLYGKWSTIKRIKIKQ